MTGPARLPLPLLVVWLACLLSSGCIHDDIVTTRPVYAYPGNLVSLCHAGTTLNLTNQGEFVTADFTDKSNGVLLSLQLLPFPIHVHRHIVAVTLAVSANGRISAEVADEDGTRFPASVSSLETHCNGQGELVISYPADSYYFWASVGNKTRELALWTNADKDLVVQNRWRETQTGLVSGEITGDAWAVFRHVDPPTASAGDSVTQHGEIFVEKYGGECEPLNGDFSTVGNVISPDGRLNTRTAVAQFYREEIIGAHPVNQQPFATSRLELVHEKENGVALNLYGDDELLATRLMRSSDISCIAGKWAYSGEVKAQSAWLLIAASAGVYWENMNLWLDKNGDLLVEGTYKSRGALFLVPFGQTERIFVAFVKMREGEAARPTAEINGEQQQPGIPSTASPAMSSSNTPGDNPATNREAPVKVCSDLKKTAQYQAAKLCYLQIVDNKTASDFYRQEAYFALGMIYELGLGVESDLEVAKDFYRKAGLVDEP